MAAAKCRNRRRELTDTLQAVSIFSDLCGHASFSKLWMSSVWRCLVLSLTGNWPTWGWEIRSSKRHCQPAQREGEAGVHPRCTQTHLQDPHRHGRQYHRIAHRLRFGPRDPQRHYLSGFHTKRDGYNLFQQLAVFQRALHRQLQLHGEDLRPGALTGGVSGALGQSWAGNGSLCPRHGPVQLPVHSRLGAALHARQHWPGAPVHARRHLHSSLHHLYVFLYVHLPRERHLPQLWADAPEGQQQQRPVVRVIEFPNPSHSLRIYYRLLEFIFLSHNLR